MHIAWVMAVDFMLESVPQACELRLLKAQVKELQSKIAEEGEPSQLTLDAIRPLQVGRQECVAEARTRSSPVLPDYGRTVIGRADDPLLLYSIAEHLSNEPHAISPRHADGWAIRTDVPSCACPTPSIWWGPGRGGDPGVIHGGALTEVLDKARRMVVPRAQLSEAKLAITALDLRIYYMRRAKPLEDLMVEAECYQLTRAIVRAPGLLGSGRPDHCQLRADFYAWGQSGCVWRMGKMRLGRANGANQFSRGHGHFMLDFVSG